MNNITAIGFDLVNTLVIAEPGSLKKSMNALLNSLKKEGLSFKDSQFLDAYQNTIEKYIKKTRKDGKESHNRYWISEALHNVGYEIPSYDGRISRAVQAYFTVFEKNFHPIPGTRRTLIKLRQRYHLGLLSNFTHAPAARAIMDKNGLSPFFDVILISGDLGYRKPHPIVFKELMEKMGVRNSEMIYVGDDPEPDLIGPKQVGIVPVWTTYVRDHTQTFNPQLVPGLLNIPDFKVSTISDWEELFTLLEWEDS